MNLFNLFKRKKKAYHHVLDVGDDNFEVQVLQRSYKTPVMVDYWASWCGPCRQLGPVLERIAVEADSGFLLAKLNTENNRRTAARYNIRSIPAVKVFRNGQIVGEFVGLRLEHQIRSFIDEITSAPPPNPHVKVSGNPDKRLKQAKSHLKKARGFRAAVCLEDFPASRQAQEAAQLLPLAHFLWDIEDGDAFTGNDELDDRYEAAVDALEARRPGDALEALHAAENLGSSEDQAHTREIVVALETLLA